MKAAVHHHVDVPRNGYIYWKQHWEESLQPQKKNLERENAKFILQFGGKGHIWKQKPYIGLQI